MGNLVSSISEDAKTYKELQKGAQETPGGTIGVVETPKTPSPFGGESNALLNNPKIAPLVDPRSPSQGVSRTPLEIEERNRRIERTRLKNQLNKENNLTVPQTTLFPATTAEELKTPTGPADGKEFPFGFDPRSPNPEISRTPITLAEQQQHQRHIVGKKMFHGQEKSLE